METASDHFYARVAEAYDHLAEQEPDRFLRLDGTQSIETIHEQVREDVDQLIAAATSASPPTAGL
jgi:thymidylate kinase